MSKNPKKHGRLLTPLTVYSALRYTGIYPQKEMCSQERNLLQVVSEIIQSHRGYALQF